MKATVFHGPNDIRVEEVGRPHAGGGEAVIRVTLTTICGAPETVASPPAIGSRSVCLPDDFAFEAHVFCTGALVIDTLSSEGEVMK